MPAGRRLFREEERFHARGRRSGGLDVESLEAAAQALLDCWPWLTEQYRQGNVTELPTGPVEAAIRRYMEHAGL
jgi:hypothetical protein